jgi:hypothetical protein
MKRKHFIIVFVCSVALVSIRSQETPAPAASSPAPLVAPTPAVSTEASATVENTTAPEAASTAGQPTDQISQAPAENEIRTSSQNRNHRRRHHRHRDPVVVVQPTPVFIEPRSESFIFEQVQTPQTIYTSEPSVGESPPPIVNYASLGREWAVALRRGAVSETQFVEFMRNYIVYATALDYRTFYEAFVNAYGPYGSDVFGEAFKRAYY